MPTNKNGNRRNKEAARNILAKMNDMVRGKNFAKVVMDQRFEQLDEKIHELGWLALVKDQKAKRTAKGLEVYVRLKLVDPDSEEAKRWCEKAQVLGNANAAALL